MIKNNKGVTLVELLIVIVVMGIIAAFSVPAVRTIIDNQRQSAIAADAMNVESQAKLLCSQSTTCAAGTTTYTWADIKNYVEGIDTTYYNIVDATVVATYEAGGFWSINLPAANAGDYEWVAANAPSSYDPARDGVTVAP